MEISSYLGATGIKVLPGKQWGVHYKDPQRREEILQGVLSGRISPDQVNIEDLKPAGMSYPLQEAGEVGLQSLLGKVRDRANFYEHFDYNAYLDFLSGLSGHEVDLETATRLFNSIGRSRVQSELLRTLGATGKMQLKSSLQDEARSLLQAPKAGRVDSLLELLKMRWLEKHGLVSPSDREQASAKAGQAVAALASELDDAYVDYVQTGSPASKSKLVEAVRGSFEKIKKQVKADQVDEAVDAMLKNYDDLPPEIQQQIDQAFDDFQPLGGDSVPEARDTQDLSMNEMEDVPEGQKIEPLYTVDPPITGYYRGQIYSRFNARTLEWELDSNRNFVVPSAGSEHVMQGKKINPGSTVVFFLPGTGKYEPALIPSGTQLSMDKNGTYYLTNLTSSPIVYDVSFGKKQSLNNKPPLEDEKKDVAGGGLSLATRNYVNSLRGKSNIEKAQAIIHYMKNVLGLQYSTDSKYNRIYKSKSARYFLEIEKHKQVDCKVAQTYFIALCRLAGIPSRMITGHSVDLVQDGKAVLHSGTGHAWTEIWDEQSGSWQSIDATPEKDEQEKKGQQGGDGGGGNAPKEDTDIEAPPKEQTGDSPSPEQLKKKVDDQVEQTQGQSGQSSGESQSGGKSGDQGEGQSGGQSGPPDNAKEKLQQIAEQQSGGQEASQSGQSGGSAGSESGGEGQISEQDWNEMQRQMEEMQQEHQEMSQKAAELQEKLRQTESLKDLKSLEKELEEAELYDEVKDQLEEALEAKKDQAKKELKEEIEKMMQDGFITEEEAERLLQELEADDMDTYMKIEQQLEHESALYNEYEEIRQEVMPLVNKWFEFFAERLPKIEEIDYDEDARTRRGRFDRRSISRPRNLLFGQTQNPPVISRSTVPRFMASLVIDISGSMSSRMRDARKLLIFFSELFDKISEEFGYIKFSISAFDTAVELIKDFNYEYGAPTRYDFGGSEKTVKVRLMEMTMARGGTDMGKAVWDANKRLNDEKLDHPDYLSALYTISDGETSGELAGASLSQFLAGQKEFWGEWWGEHMKCGFMLGPESQKSVLSQYFGEDDSESVPQIEELIEKVMTRFDEDVQNFIDNLPAD